MENIERYANIKGAFTEEECRSIIKDVLAEQLNPGYSPGMMIDPDTRSSMIRFLYKENVTYRWIFDRLFWMLDEMYPHDTSITTLNFVQFTEYDSLYAGHFVKHRDTQVFYHPTSPTKLVRRLTCVVQLSDPESYQGGELILYPENDNTLIAEKAQGSAIMFPSNTLHEVLKVTAGTRYSLVAWFEGPKE